MTKRVEFSASVKRNLADRVAWRCCYPNCTTVTIGPGSNTDNDVINLGEAAHIYAASPGGPRPNNEMTDVEKSSIENGIWMCRHHARLIDSDFSQYSADTLKLWKKLKEDEAAFNLKNPSALIASISTKPTTLVSIGHRIIFEGIWKSIEDNQWTFQIKHFIFGDLELVRELSIPSERSPLHYVVVESQGDGRLLTSGFTWRHTDIGHEITVTVLNKEPRLAPNNIGGDIALDEEGDLLIEDGDFKIATGVDVTVQWLRDMLSTSFGELKFSPTTGSYASDYYWKYRNNPLLLSRLLKIEIARLIAIPEFDPTEGTSVPVLNFINRISAVTIDTPTLVNDRLSIHLKLEWGDGTPFEKDLSIYIHPEMK